ncbi:hypothetical protein [Terrisporobacter sp.]
MNYITKYELDNKDLASKFSIENGSLVFNENSLFKEIFQVGDIITLKNDTKKIGVISSIEDDELNISWNDNSQSIKNSDDLIIIPPSVGLQLIQNSDLLKLWEELSNGKDDNFDLKCLYINDEVINEVPFIKSYKNTDTIVDKRFKRKFSLYRKFSNRQIYKTNLYTISNGNIGLDNSRFVYYLLTDNVIYYLGIDLNSNDLNTYLFNK